MNPAIVSEPGSAIRALNSRKRATSIDLGLGEPSLAANPAYFERATEWVRTNGCRYSPNAGEGELRAAIAAHYAYPGLEAVENVCVTNGSQEAVYAALAALLDPARDELLIVEPIFPVYGKIAAVLGVATRTVACDPDRDFAFDVEKIAAAIGPKTRMIVICSPCNPTGRVVTRADAEALAEVLLARPGAPIYLVHDEIYREIDFVADAGRFGAVYPATISINSLSKSNALTGLRLGWSIAPREETAQIVKLHGWLTSCASTFAQRIALEIFSVRDLRSSLAWYEMQRDVALDAARAAGLHVAAPDGAFYLFVRLGAVASAAFVDRLLDEDDVVAIPGAIFGACAEGWLRTSFLAPPAALREAFARIARRLGAEAG